MCFYSLSFRVNEQTKEMNFPAGGTEPKRLIVMFPLVPPLASVTEALRITQNIHSAKLSRHFSG